MMNYVSLQLSCKFTIRPRVCTHDLCSVYSLFSALIMHVYQMRSSVPSIVSTTQDRMQVCMDALKEVSKVWLVAKMVHTLFLSILGNKTLEERLQKAAGKRHKKPRLDNAQPNQQVPPIPDSPPKSRFDDLTLGYTIGPPAPQVSFERSRPQTPALTPSRDLIQNQPNPNNPSMSNSSLSPTMRQSDAFMGTSASRTNTRPPTPFNASYSMPVTPPDLYLVTRNSPTISQSLWENFQPDQLFPENTNMNFAYGGTSGNLDPALQMSGIQTPAMGGIGGIRGMDGGIGVQGQGGIQHDTSWMNQMSPDDSWSNSSRGGPAVPTTLNVEDW